MEVLDTCDALPCNAEVLQFLREDKSKLAAKGAKDKRQAKAATVVLETLRYLEKTPAATLSKNYTNETLNAFLAAIAKFNLSSSEKLNLLNHCPDKEVEVQVLVEDSEERLSETDVSELLSLVKVHLLGITDSEETPHENGEGGDEDQPDDEAMEADEENS